MASAAICPLLDVGAAIDDLLERFLIIEQHAIAQHLFIVVGESFPEGTVGAQLKPAGNGRFVVDPVS